MEKTIKKNLEFWAKIFLFALIFLYSIFYIPNSTHAATIGKPTNFLSLKSGLVGYWTFDGKDMLNGKALDRSGNNNTGTLNNIATSTFYKAGKIGQGFKFDGGDDYVTKSSFSGGTTGAVTISLWGKPANTTSDQYVVDYGRVSGGDSRTIILGFQNGYWNIYKNAYPTGTAADTQIAASGPEIWDNIVYTSNGTTLQGYRNGQLIINVSANLNRSLAPDTINIGRPVDVSSNYYGGSLDDVRIYNRALSAGEIKQLYNMGGEKIAKTVAPVNNLKTGLVGYWTFDGKDMLNGKALDRSGNNNTGTLINIATSTFYKAGKIGQAFNFDGVNDYVNVGSANSLDNLATIAISLWVYRYQSSGDLISKDRNNPYGWRLFSAGTNSLSFSVSYSSTALSRTAANNTFPLNKWIHVVLVWNGATSTDTTAIKMYKDGIEVNYTGNTVGGIGNRMDDNTAEVYLGVRCPACGSPLYAKSILDDVRIYNRALTAGEIKQLYNLGGEKIAKTVAPVNNLKTGLVGYWTFDGKDMLNGKALDKSGNNNTGSLLNIATSTFYKAGKIGQGFKFDGVNDLVNASNPSAFNNISALTLSVWVYPKANAESSGSYILNKSSYWASGWSFSYHNDNSIRFGVDYDGASDLIVRSSSSKISANQWSHWILTWDGTLNASGVHIYKNGVEVSYQTTTNGVGNRVSDSSSSVIIGNQSAADRSFPGTLDDVRIYNRALTAGEIRQLYNLGR